MTKLPRAILFDLDDTILSAYRNPELAWESVVQELSSLLGPQRPAEVVQAIVAQAREFWADASQHKHWRLRLHEEVAAPQRLGIWAIWYDPDGRGLPQGSSVRPDRTIRSLSELLPRQARDAAD